jgi:ribosomal protein S18 acetylase RimI-like enzyme
MADKERDEALREMAANRGCKLVKSRRRKPGGDYGRYGLADRKSGKQVFGFGKDGLAATAGEIEDFLRGSAASTWKSSLAASGKASKAAKAGKPPPPPPPAPATARRSRPAAEAAPEPKSRPKAPEVPAPLRIRAADSVDSEAIALLLAELGYEAAADDVADRLLRLARGGEPVLLARQGEETLGCLTWHVTPNIHRPWPVGRITLLMVARQARRRGIGRELIQAAERRMIERGCGLIEVTSNVKRRAAHAFYEKLGFERTSHRFSRSIKK